MGDTAKKEIVGVDQAMVPSHRAGCRKQLLLDGTVQR